MNPMPIPKFSVVVIVRNEAKTLPRLLASLTEFQSCGGEVLVVDTGSEDGTPKVARSLDCVVHEVGSRFHYTISAEEADAINERFVVGGEAPVIKRGHQLFDFSGARNYAASLAKNNVVSMPDGDEVYTNLNIAYINAAIDRGIEQMEFNFIFAHDVYGNPAVKFLQCKMYDRRKLHWVGVVHEILAGEAKRELLPEGVLLLEHWQNAEQKRGQYLTGLAVDCYRNPDNDRNSHYFGRELVWTQRPKSALLELRRHIAMNRWPAERAQSMVFVGDAYGQLNMPEEQAHWYNQAIYLDPSRREAFIKLAHFFRHNKKYAACAAYAAAALQIPWHGFYANHVAHYRQGPHELLYWARGWMGDIAGAREHLLKAMEYLPYNPIYLRDTQFYFEYPDSGIEGWMRYDEILWLYETAKKMETIAELGSWKGRSTHALASGCKRGTVTAVDHFLGSAGEEAAHAEAKKGDTVYEQFCKNTAKLTNLIVKRTSTQEAVKGYPDGSFDMVFIDAEHTYEGVKNDIRTWRPKAKILLCGHDYCPQWPDVQRAVDEEVGLVKVAGTIWYKLLREPMVSIIIPTLGRPGKLRRLLQAIRENAGYERYEVIVKPDQFPPNNQGVPTLLAQGVAESQGELVMYLGNDCIPKKDFLQLAVFAMLRHFPELDGLIGLNDGYWKGEFATHWLAGKKLLPLLDGEFFHKGYHHVGCDNELTERCRKAGKYVWCEQAEVYHDHPVQPGFKEEYDEVYKLAFDEKRGAEDRVLLLKRSKEFGFPVRGNYRRPVIPRKIFTIWLSEEAAIPDLISKCIATHKIPGYEHHVITLANCDQSSPYVQACLKAKNWVKAVDYLRIWYLWKHGGIYLDADVEVLQGKNFDELLPERVFAGVEKNKFIGNSVIGAEAGHPVLRKYLDQVEARFKGDDQYVFEAGMQVWTELLYRASREDLGIHLCPPEYFFPYDHQTGDVQVTDKTLAYHHFFKSWVAA